MNRLWDKGRDGDIARTPEDRVAICKVLLHAVDYCKAIIHYGKDFYLHPAPKRGYQDNYVYENGIEARSYFFESQDNDLGLEKMCELFGWNIHIIRKRLAELTPEQAKEFGNFYAHAVHGDRQGKKE